MFLVNFEFTSSLEQVDLFVSAHRAHLSKFYDSGELLLGGRKVPRTGGIILSRHHSIEDVKRVFDTDPMVCAGVAKYSLIEFQPVMMAEALTGLI
ncbi:GTP cyclohydrolase [Burkholderiaceae bacterium DAT-1]|nr:GTP cyclohydrolase [Burkholderiaceae bacterium DAT-1]